MLERRMNDMTSLLGLPDKASHTKSLPEGRIKAQWEQTILSAEFASTRSQYSKVLSLP